MLAHLTMGSRAHLLVNCLSPSPLLPRNLRLRRVSPADQPLQDTQGTDLIVHDFLEFEGAGLFLHALVHTGWDAENMKHPNILFVIVFIRIYFLLDKLTAKYQQCNDQ